MKKILVGTLAVAAIVAVSATAMAEESKIRLKLGGFYTGAIVIGDVDGLSQDTRIGSDGELRVGGDAILDNGIEVGFMSHIQFEDNSSRSLARGQDDDVVDEAYMWVKGGFGKVYFGQQDGIGDLFAVNSPSAFTRMSANDSDIDPGIGGVISLSPNHGLFSVNTVNDSSDDDLKIGYMTPAIAGIKLGISFAPENEKSPEGFTSGMGNDFDSAIEFGGAYVNSFSDVEVKLAATYVMADDDSADPTVMGDPSEWNAGVSVSFSGLTIGGSYRASENFVPGCSVLGTLATCSAGATALVFDEYTAYDVGVGYQAGPWSVSAQYAAHDAENAAGADQLDGNTYVLAGSYKFGKGLRLGAGYQYQQDDIWNLESSSFVLESALKF